MRRLSAFLSSNSRSKVPLVCLAPAHALMLEQLIVRVASLLGQKVSLFQTPVDSRARSASFVARARMCFGILHPASAPDAALPPRVRRGEIVFPDRTSIRRNHFQ